MFRPQIKALEAIVWRAERKLDTRVFDEAMDAGGRPDGAGLPPACPSTGRRWLDP